MDSTNTTFKDIEQQPDKYFFLVQDYFRRIEKENII